MTERRSAAITTPVDPPRRRINASAEERAQAAASARSTVTGVLLLQVFANGLGMLVVAAYLRFLFPIATTGEQNELNLLIFGIYILVMLTFALPLNMLLLRRAVSWVREARQPTAAQRRLVLRLPGLETLSAFISWLGAAALFGIINSGARRVGIGIGLAGLVVCTILYLLLEGHFRPVFALALADADLPEKRRDVLPRLMLAWFLGNGVSFIMLGLTTMLEPAPLEQHRLLWLSIAGVIGGGLVMGAAASSVARPITRVREALRSVEQGDLDVTLPVDDLGELGRLAEGVNDLVLGLREREELRDLFGRQVGRTELATLATGGDVSDSGELRAVSVLFVDLRGYTRYSEHHSPEEVVAMLNRFFRVVVAVINREGGWVNKFEGDAALCLFGAPKDQPDHAYRALRAAADIPRELARDPDVLPCGVGVASGTVLAGFIGTPERFEYTVIGDVVNIAERLCELAKNERGGVLASLDTLTAAGSPDNWVQSGSVRVRGRRERTAVAIPTRTRSRWDRLTRT